VLDVQTDRHIDIPTVANTGLCMCVTRESHAVDPRRVVDTGLETENCSLGVAELCLGFGAAGSQTRSILGLTLLVLAVCS